MNKEISAIITQQIGAESMAKIMNRARHSAWGIAINDETQLYNQVIFRINYLMNELGIPASKIPQHGQVITHSATSNAEFANIFREYGEQLERNFGLSRTILQKCPRLVFVPVDKNNTSPNSINQKINYINEKFGLTADLLNKHPYPLLYSIEDNGSATSLPYKFRYYTQEFDFGKREFCKSPSLLSLDCSNNNLPTSVPNKAKFLNTYAQIGARQIRNSPVLLNLDCDPNSTSPSALINKIKILKEQYGLNESAWQVFPVLLMLDCNPNSQSPTSVAKKLEFFYNELGFEPAQINSYPNLLGLDCSLNSDNPASIINKVKFYEELGITKADLKKCVNLLGYDCDKNSNKPSAVINKIRVLDEIGLDRAIIKKMPILLGMPTNKIKIRYMLYSISELSKIGLKSSIFIQNEAKTYARIQYLNDINYTTNKQAVIWPEHRFKDFFGTPTSKLMQIYPLNNEAIHNVENEFYQKYDKQIKLTSHEIDSVCQRGV